MVEKHRPHFNGQVRPSWVAVLVATRPISHGEPLSLSYGRGYWPSRGITPLDLSLQPVEPVKIEVPRRGPRHAAHRRRAR